MKKMRKMCIRDRIAGCIILGGTGTAYAANVGGIQRTVQIWLHGDQTQATLDVSNDGTCLLYTSRCV